MAVCRAQFSVLTNGVFGLAQKAWMRAISFLLIEVLSDPVPMP
jgi:hypothetical protein